MRRDRLLVMRGYSDAAFRIALGAIIIAALVLRFYRVFARFRLPWTKRASEPPSELQQERLNAIAWVTEELNAGAAILDQLMRSHGFSFKVTEAGVGSGGPFATGEFRREGRWLELHVRRSLGLVSYHVDIFQLSHEDYMWSVLGRRWASHYPGFSNSTLDAFRHLLADLEQYGSDFLTGTDRDFTKHIRRSRDLRASSPRLP